MNKLTKEEIQELKILMTRLEEADFEDAEAEDENEVEIDIRKWVEQKKKEWTEQAYEEGKEDDDFNNHVERELGSLERQADEQCVELLDLGDTDLND